MLTKHIKGVILGPTASGKTAAGVAICQKLGGNIISADSRQIYRGLHLLANKEGEPEVRDGRIVYLKNGIAQYGLDLCDIGERFTAVSFAEEVQALDNALVEDLWLVGGTGLYIDMAMTALEALPEDLAIRTELEQCSDSDLREKALAQPGVTAELISGLPRRRLIRKLEVAAIQNQWPAEYDFVPSDKSIPWYGIRPKIEKLEEHITERFSDENLRAMLDEASGLRQAYSDEQLIMLGLWVKDSVEALENNLSIDQFRTLVTVHTRQYAKRQLTWWHRHPWIKWFDSADALIQAVIK